MRRRPRHNQVRREIDSRRAPAPSSAAAAAVTWQRQARAARSCYPSGQPARDRAAPAAEADGLLQQAGDAYRLTAAGHRWGVAQACHR